MSFQHRGSSAIIIILIIAMLLATGLFFFGYQWVKNLAPEKIIQSSFVKKQLNEESQSVISLLPRILGYTEPLTYLVLFENNTELRPGGGFIGVYAVLKLDKGKLEILKMEGTENFDRQTPADWKPEAPEPIRKHLKVDRWYFRDSNWSPDFSFSAKKAWELYKGEKGVAAEEIDAVVAFTPIVLEELLRLTGPLTVQGMEFTAENVTEKLEYEVEYGYDDKGIAFHERKQIILPLFLTLLDKLKGGILINFKNYFSLLDKLAKEKQLMAYAPSAELQNLIVAQGMNGELSQTTGDYLLWVDANLAALKTDHAIKRTLSYVLKPSADGRFLAEVEMNYQHMGKFDWRTTRYRTYARVFAPLGSELVKVDGAMEWDRSAVAGQVKQGEESGKKWFGAFVAIEPGKSGTLRFQYLLSKSISEQIKNGSYTLFVQKQLGAIGTGLTLSLNFGKNIKTAEPSENVDEWNDAVYKISTDLRVDREFKISLKR